VPGPDSIDRNARSGQKEASPAGLGGARAKCRHKRPTEFAQGVARRSFQLLDRRHHAPASIAPRPDGCHRQSRRMFCATVNSCPRAPPRRRWRQNCKQSETAFPHPFFDEFPLNPLVITFDNRRKLNASTRFSARNRKKARQHWITWISGFCLGHAM
jgi:hypothetical protein